jgi:CRP/FNR family transcriptional regulator, dissimilatory nitrate respiration regulator
MENFVSPLFQGLTEDELQQMLSSPCVRRASYQKGDIIFHAGQMVGEVGIVLSGTVRIESIDLWGDRSILSNVSKGQVFAETYALCHEPMMVDAVAAEDCEILLLHADCLQQAQKDQKPWAMQVMNNMLRVSMQKNLTLSTRIFCTSGKTIRSRLLTYLTYQSVKHGSTTFQIPFDRQQLADYLNLDRSALSKELGKMRDEGLVEFYKNSFKLKGKD